MTVMRKQLRPETTYTICFCVRVCRLRRYSSREVTAAARTSGRRDFDANIESLGGVFAFDASVNRAVSASTEGITESLAHVYDAKDLVHELMQK